ncbi:MAG: STAS domain-containing protein, partial [Leptospiraceae bacterium]|nr:STAS domain-containing protein [Leptospiraceae bacterium]
MKILAIRGVLDSSTGHRFERSLMELLREHREPIGLDFSGLKYMTSAGVASFLRVSQKAKERNSQLAIIRPSQEVGMMLDFL